MKRLLALAILLPAIALAQVTVNPGPTGTPPSYQTGTWTPVMTATTPGDLNVVYSTQLGNYTKIGRMVLVTWNIITSTFTWTTATGTAQITGLPFTLQTAVAVNYHGGGCLVSGVTKAGYTNFAPRITGGTTASIMASGSAQVGSNVAITEMPSAGTVNLQCTLTYDAVN